MRRLLPVLALGGLAVLTFTTPVAAAPRPGFGWPLAGTPHVDRAFTPPRTAYAAGHRGVDLTGFASQPVLAAGPGQVTYAGLLAGRGVVTVTHTGGLRTTYEPVTASVHLGQSVALGTVLGRLGTGHASCHTGTTCLHWGLLRGDTYLDPLRLLTPTAVRLLPLGGAGAHAPFAAAPGGRGGPAPTVWAVAPEQSSGNWSRSTRATAAAAAGGALLAGLGLLVSRPRAGPVAGRSSPAPRPPRGPASPQTGHTLGVVDLEQERRRRRAA